jgi:hypothetical protein
MRSIARLEPNTHTGSPMTGRRGLSLRRLPAARQLEIHESAVLIERHVLYVEPVQVADSGLVFGKQPGPGCRCVVRTADTGESDYGQQCRNTCVHVLDRLSWVMGHEPRRTADRTAPADRKFLPEAPLAPRFP